MNLFKLILLFLSVVILQCNILIAQNNIADSLNLPELLVIEKMGGGDMRSTTPTQTLSESTLNSLNSLQLSDAVKHFSGVTIKDYGGIGGLKTLSVRSLGANHTSVSYNGVTVNDVQTGQIDIGRFSLENIKNINLNIGQSDQIFLPARAMAGASILNIITGTPKFKDNEKFNGQASVKAGSFGFINPSFSTNIKLSDKISASFSSEWMTSHGQYPYTLHYGESGIDSSSVERRENTDVENLRLETALFAEINNNTNGDIRLYYYKSERGLPGATIFYNTENFSKQRLWDETFFIQSHLEHSISNKLKIQADSKYNRGYLKYFDPAYLGADGKIEDTFNQNEIYGSLSMLYRPFNSLSVALANDITSVTMSSNRTDFANPQRVTSHSSISAKWVNDQIIAIGSMLYTQTFESVQTGNPAENRSKLSPHISISYNPLFNKNVRFRAFFKNSFRLPTFNDLYYPLVGLRNLRPEDANQLNLGVTYAINNGYNTPSIQFSIDTYQNTIKNKIVAYPSGNLFQWTMMNLGEVQINGIDLSTEGKANIFDKTDLYLGASFTYQKAVDKTNKDKITYNHQIPYTPKYSGSVRALIELFAIDLSYTLIWSGKRYSNSYNSKEYALKGYTDHAISVSKDIVSYLGILEVGLEVLNLTNKNYEIVRNYPMPGRSFRGKISINY